MTDIVRGIDTSSAQGAYDFGPWRGKIDYAWIKATESTDYGDPDFRHDWAALHDLGVVRFAYHYMHPAATSPQAQARYCLDYVHGNGGWSKGDHVILDMELTQGLAGHEVSNWAAAFRRSINAAGKRCVFYTYPAFANAGNCVSLGGHYLAIADYQDPVPKRPLVPQPWRDWLMWQWSGTDIDQSIYNGTRDELRHFAGLD